MVPLLLGPPASLLFFYFDLSHATRGLGHNGTKTHTRMKSITKENVAPSCGVGALPREVLWRQLFCRGPGGGAMFTICGSCYRGQVYCGERCRRRMRRQQMRLANRRHQDSPEGRARSPGPATGLPGKVPPARDGSWGVIRVGGEHKPTYARLLVKRVPPHPWRSDPEFTVASPLSSL